MATNLDDRPLSLEVQRAQAEERRQRQDELYYELEVRKHELEKDKSIIDILKHFTTLTTALLFILAYFGDQIISGQKTNPFLGFTFWDMAVAGLGFSLGLSLLGMIILSSAPSGDDFLRKLAKILLWIMLFLMGGAIGVVTFGLFYL